MIKTTITERTERYDKDGNLIEVITKTETTEDDETRYPRCYADSFDVHTTLLNYNHGSTGEDK